MTHRRKNPWIMQINRPASWFAFQSGESLAEEAKTKEEKERKKSTKSKNQFNSLSDFIDDRTSVYFSLKQESVR